MDAGREISQAFAEIQVEEEGERRRLQYRAAMKVLRTIPSGTPDGDLTSEQRQAWKDHDDALAWLESATTREP